MKHRWFLPDWDNFTEGVSPFGVACGIAIVIYIMVLLYGTS